MKKVLILEDEVNIRSFVVINLKRAGLPDAIEAGTGEEALDRTEGTSRHRRGHSGYHAAGHRRL